MQAQSDGSFDGTVVRATSLSHCTHPVGEVMWDEVRAQSDGSYWGRHQWFRSSTCETIGRGNTAFRVLAKPDGARFLRVCFADEDEPAIQPTIAADGSSANATQGCADSDLVSELPQGTPPLQQVATLPSTKRCVSKRVFRIRLKEPRGDALKSAVVYLNGKVVARRDGTRLTAPIDLRGLPKGRYTVRIVAVTHLGRTIKGTRKYRTCARKRRSGGSGPL